MLSVFMLLNGEMCEIIRLEQIVLDNTAAYNRVSIVVNKHLSTSTCKLRSLMLPDPFRLSSLIDNALHEKGLAT